MPNYRRAELAGGTYFITQVTHHRQPWLIPDIGSQALQAETILDQPAGHGLVDLAAKDEVTHCSSRK